MNKQSERPSPLPRNGRVVRPPAGPLLIDYTPAPPYVPLFVSDNITEHLGYEPGEIIGNPNFLINTIHTEDVPQFLSGLFHLYNRGYHVYEYRLKGRGGTLARLLTELRLQRNPDGRPLKITSVFSEPTVLAGELPPDGAVIELTVDSGGRIDRVSPTVQDVLGYKPKDVLGRHVLEFIPLDYQIAVNKVLMRMLECCLDRVYFWAAAGRRDGALRFLANECRGGTDDRGERIITAVCHDITDRVPLHRSCSGSRCPHPSEAGSRMPPDGRAPAPEDPFDMLTAREREVLFLIVEGHSSTRIGTRLSISPRTVESHRASLMKKLRVHSMPQLIRYSMCRMTLR